MKKKSTDPIRHHFLEGVLYTLLSENPEKRLLFIQVGANDGYTVDPLFRFCYQKQMQNTEIIAIEPQRQVLQALQKNYEQHPRFVALNALVGAKGIKSLYSIHSHFWDYYTGFTGSGITSTDYQHVKQKALSLLPAWVIEKFPIDQIVCRDEMNVIPLSFILEKLKKSADVIQIDTEGNDDEVIYSIDLSRFRPRVIAFETVLIERRKASRLFEYLAEHKYRVIESSDSDHCAIREID